MVGSLATVAVIVPALNEGDAIEYCLRAARAAATGGAAARHAAPALELVVVDGGSTDDTVSRARGLGSKVVKSVRGRARQMNAGAAACRGEILVFCHADSQLPPGSLDAVRRILADPSVSGGCFRLRFDHDHPLLRIYAACTRLPCWWAHYGDAVFFVRRADFEAIGGYAALPLMEDVDLQLRLRRRGRWEVLPASVITSARRFLLHGPLRQQLKNALLVGLWALGVSSTRLARLYEPSPSSNPSITQMSPPAGRNRSNNTQSPRFDHTG